MIDLLNKQNDEQIREDKTTKLPTGKLFRVYRSWGFLIVASLFLVSLATYLLTGNFTWRPGSHWRWSVETKDKYGTELPPVTHDP